MSERRTWMRLREGEHSYSMPDPDGCLDAYGRAYAACHPQPFGSAPPVVELERGDLVRLLALARGYVVLTMDGGQEQMVGKLRDVRRELRGRSE